jgi:mono/diheme cytochrome c family protein
MADSFDPKPANLVMRLRNHSEGDFFWKISNGRGLMPGFEDQLRETQIWDVINFIKSL